jgi:thioredoxin 1
LVTINVYGLDFSRQSSYYTGSKALSPLCDRVGRNLIGGQMVEINHISEDSFKSEVLESSQPVLVDFTAVWCGPCKLLDPVVKQLAQEWDGKVKVVKLDVDNNPDLAMNYQVMGVPTLMMFVDGSPVQRVTGYQPKDRLAKKFAPHIQVLG